MENMKSLKGYRIGLLKDYTASGDYSAGSSKQAGRWARIKDEGPVRESLFYKAPEELEEFKAWWGNEMAKARDEKTTMVVVDVRDGANVWKNHLKVIEEEEWERGVENGVRFTTLKSILRTVSSGEQLVDMWGDDIVRGEGSIFLGDLFASSEAIVDDPRLSFDPDAIKKLVLQEGGEMFEGFAGLQEPADTLAAGSDRICYIVAPGGSKVEAEDILSADLLERMDEHGIRTEVVNSLWIQACCEVGGKFDPKQHPLLFQPLPWPLQAGLSFPVKISVSGLARPLRFAVGHKARAMGATCTDDLSSENTHLIWKRGTLQGVTPIDDRAMANFEAARKLDVLAMPLEWLYHVMENGCDHLVEKRLSYVRVVVGSRRFCVKKRNLVSTLLKAYAEGKGIPVSQYQVRYQGKMLDDCDVELHTLVHGHDAAFDVVRIADENEYVEDDLSLG